MNMVQPYSGSLYSFPSLCCCTLTVNAVQVWVGSPLMHVYIIPSPQGTYLCTSPMVVFTLYTLHTHVHMYTQREIERERERELRQGREGVMIHTVEYYHTQTRTRTHTHTHTHTQRLMYTLCGLFDALCVRSCQTGKLPLNL